MFPYPETASVLGKLANLYDEEVQHAKDFDYHRALLDRQISDLENPEQDELFDGFQSELGTTNDSGSAAAQDRILARTRQWLTSKDFATRFVVEGNLNPLSNLAARLQALAVEMTADQQSFTDKAATGIVNFLTTLAATSSIAMPTSPAIPTASPGTLPDLTFCIPGLYT